MIHSESEEDANIEAGEDSTTAKQGCFGTAFMELSAGVAHQPFQTAGVDVPLPMPELLVP